MSDGGQRPLGRLTLLLVLVVLVMTSSLAVYVMFVKGQSLPLIVSPESDGPDPMQKMKLLLAMVLVTVLAILAFVVGAYLFIRLGRALTARRISDGPTEFVDAWSNYRVTQDEIEAVNDMLDGNEGDEDDPPADDPFNGPDQDDHDSQDER